MDRQIDRQTDRQTDRRIDRLTDGFTGFINHFMLVDICKVVRITTCILVYNFLINIKKMSKLRF